MSCKLEDPPLGEGAFGIVFLLKVKEGGQEYALKVSKVRRELPKEQRKAALKGMEAEAQRMKDLSHPHVVQCGEFARVDDERMYLVLEYCTGGSLRKAIIPGIDQAQAHVWFSQMADAIKYLHEMKIMHRDIKPENILLDANRNIKMGDLGIAWDEANTLDYLYQFCGSPYYMSPQLCNRERYSKKADIWSLGCVFHEVLNGRPTFTDKSAVTDGPIPSLPAHYSIETQKLINEMLERKESNRLDSKSVFDRTTKLLRGKYQQIPFRPMGKPNLNKEEVINSIFEKDT